MASSFEDIAIVGIDNFNDIYKVKGRVSIVEVVRMTTFFLLL